MRGQEPGSEHDRREADSSAAPATPPPSFGQISEQDAPSAFAPADEAARGSADGEARDSADGRARGSADDVTSASSGRPASAPHDDAAQAPFSPSASAGAEGRPAIPVFHGPPPNLPDPDEAPGAQPWEVSGDDAAPYDWFDEAEPTRPGGLRPLVPLSDETRPGLPPASRPPAELDRPGLPPAAQPPAELNRSGLPPADRPSAEPDHLGRAPFGQAEHPPVESERADQTRAGHVRAIRPWDEPEAEAEPDAWPVEPVVPGAPPWEPPPAFTAAAAGMPVWPAPVSDPRAMPPWPAATGELVAEPDNDDPNAPFDPNATNPEGFTRPAHYFDPETARREAAEQPEATRPGAVPPQQREGAQHPPASSAAKPADAPPSKQARAPLPAPIAPPQEETRPLAHEGTARPPAQSPHDTKQPAHYFDPKAAERDTPPVSLSDPANPSGRPAEPGDVPVWPPNPPAEAKLPDLPFPRDTWGQKSLPPGGGPAFPSGAFKQPPFQTPPPPPAPPGRSKRALFVTLGALALAGVATGGFFAYQAVSSPTPTTAAARPSASEQASSEPPSAAPSAAPTDAPGGTSILNSERTDPQKLSLSEAFPKKKVSAAGTTFTRVKADVETSCDKVATGAFADALRKQKCGRVLRATYVDSKRRYAVTTGIAVLPDKDAAAAADQAKDLSHNIWFRPLPGGAGSGGERVHIAGGYASGLVWGRYIVFSYATYADGHTPESKDKTLPKVSGALRDQTSLVLERRVTKG
ncbi:hypothetical protein [Nonomuraea sp. NPDC049784]|uniref:hypothetical protein n=1 Tax=Nonomuraea sp. NPDC049784 TaxID=3154361 RepID=UPI0033D9EC24